MPWRKHHDERSDERDSAVAATLTERAAGIGALADPLRAEIYEFVAAAKDPIGREVVAAHFKVAPHSARSQLDRLVKDGLLDVEFKRLSGKTGPGAGRPSKLYFRAEREIAVSLPARNYDLVGHILATAIDNAKQDGGQAADRMDDVAYAEGQRFGKSIDPEGADDLDRLAHALALLGFEPRRSDDTLSLRNCPFDALAKEHTELVCGLNHSYVRGVCDAIDLSRYEPVLEPEPGQCCVKIRLL